MRVTLRSVGQKITKQFVPRWVESLELYNIQLVWLKILFRLYFLVFHAKIELKLKESTRNANWGDADFFTASDPKSFPWYNKQLSIEKPLYWRHQQIDQNNSFSTSVVDSLFFFFYPSNVSLIVCHLSYFASHAPCFVLYRVRGGSCRKMDTLIFRSEMS